MHNYIPKVHIIYSYHFDSNRRELFTQRDSWYPSYEDVTQRHRNVVAIWQEKNKDDQLIKGIQEVLGVSPQYDFEIFTFGSGMNPMSHPLLLPLYNKAEKPWSDNKVIEIITHEVVHRFAASPRNESFYNTKEYWDYVKEAYKELPKATQNHLIVYAVLEKVLPIAISKEESQDAIREIKDPAYIQAIDLVQEKGPDYFIEEFKRYVSIV